MVPLIISDSMLKEVARHPRAIMIVRCGGTTKELVDCVAQQIQELRNWVPAKLWIIYSGGGNDLCAEVAAAHSRDSLTAMVTGHLERLDRLCDANQCLLTLAHVMPRPKEQDTSSRNPLVVRQLLWDSMSSINLWIERRNRGNGSFPLKLSRFLEYGQQGRRGRFYETGQPKIRCTRFREDRVHLRGRGIIDIQDALFNLIEEHQN